MSPMRVATVPFKPWDPGCSAEDASRRFHETMAQRRSVRNFAPTPVSRATIENCVAAAATAPSGANKQPWRFVAVSEPALKRQIRLGAEAEEREFYEHRAPKEWLADLAPLGTDIEKPFLEEAPWIIVIFRMVRQDADAGGRQGKVYYPQESVGIAAGMLITSLHLAGLATLTHTPSPMGFLAEILERPAHERPYLLLPVGYPSADCRVPDLARRPLHEIMVVRETA